MNQDLISNNFTENVNRNVISRNIKLLRSILILFLIYILFSIIDLYSFVTNIKNAPRSVSAIYVYRIYPFLTCITFVLGIAVWMYYTKGHKLILSSFEKDEPDIFNKGYAFLNKASTMNIIGFSIIILNSIILFCIKKSL